MPKMKFTKMREGMCKRCTSCIEICQTKENTQNDCHPLHHQKINHSPIQYVVHVFHVPTNHSRPTSRECQNRSFYPQPITCRTSKKFLFYQSGRVSIDKPCSFQQRIRLVIRGYERMKVCIW